MTPAMLRQFWRFVETVPRTASDQELMNQLFDSCRQQPPLSMLEPWEISQYISARLPLIREMVAS